MVQVIELENQKGKLSEMMGMSLGKGLGNALNTYFANRSLQSVLHDKALTNAPPHKQLEALISAASPYGEKGQELLGQYIQSAQQGLQEQEIRKQEAIQKSKGQAVGRFLNGGKLTPEEQSLFTPQEFVEMYKAKNPKPVGGISAQPVSPEISQRINGILSQTQGASADELKSIMDAAGIPPANSNPYIENRRRATETGTEHDIKFHQESSDFEKGLRNHANTARKQLPLIEEGIESVRKGKIKPNSLANVFSFFGEPGKKISNALLSGKQAALQASIPEFLEGRKELFGVRLSDADLYLLQDKLPDIGKSKEANLAILDLMKRAANRAMKLEKVAQDVLEKEGLPYRSGKLRPLGYETKVMNAFEEFERNEGTFQEIPPAAQHKGKIIEDDSGRRYKSNGQTWEPL